MVHFETIFRRLNQKKVQYLVIGGVAVNLYGFPRATGDLDLLILLEPANIKRFLGAAKAMRLIPRFPVALEDLSEPQKREEWIRHKGMKVFSLYDPKQPLMQIDVMMKNVINFKKAWNGRKIMKAGKLTIPIVSINDLIQLKRKAGRERDRMDIRVLKQIQAIQNEKKKKR